MGSIGHITMNAVGKFCADFACAVGDSVWRCETLVSVFPKLCFLRAGG